MFRIPLKEHTELRLLTLPDREQFFEVATRNIAHIREWMFWLDEHFTLEGVTRDFELMLLRFARNEELQAGIWHCDDLLGCARLYSIDWLHKKAEIGIWLDADSQGRGLATAACRALVDYAFISLRLNRIEMRCISENVRSRRIPERLGFVQEGILRDARWRKDHFADHIVFGMLAKDWGHPRTELLQDLS